MNNSEANAPEDLIRFVRAFEAGGKILCSSPADEVANWIRLSFELSHPVAMSHASCLIASIRGMEVYIQPGFENQTQTRGQWFSFNGTHLVLIDAERPNASKIKTVFHELSEQILEISHAHHPEILMRSDKERERWANKLAACVKMPPRYFLEQVKKYGLDIFALKLENDDTLAGVCSSFTRLRHF